MHGRSHDGKTEYQCQKLKNFSATKAYYTSHCAEFCSKVTECIKARLSWSNLQQLRDIIFVLATQGWQKAVDENDSLESIDRLVQQFSIPLESAGADIHVGEIHSEFEAVLQHATMYVSLSTFDYRATNTCNLKGVTDVVPWIRIMADQFPKLTMQNTV